MSMYLQVVEGLVLELIQIKVWQQLLQTEQAKITQRVQHIDPHVSCAWICRRDGPLNPISWICTWLLLVMFEAERNHR